MMNLWGAISWKALLTLAGIALAYKRRKSKMSEIIGKDVGSFGHAGVKFEAGKLSASVELDSGALVDLVIDAAEKAIPGDFDKPLLEVVRAAAKASLAKA